MSIQFDQESSLALGTGDRNWTHTPVGTPKGVIVIVVDGVTTDQVVGVTYGGAALTELATYSPNIQTGGEGGAVHVFWKGSSIATGAQTVAIDRNDATNYGAVCYTVTAESDTYIHSANSSTSTSIAAPGASLTITEPCFVCGGCYSGLNNVTSGLSAGTGTTQTQTVDFGTDGSGYSRGDSIKTSDFSFTWSQSADDGTTIVVAMAQKTKQKYGQAQAAIKTISQTFAQAQASIIKTYIGYGQANANIIYKRTSFAQSTARIFPQTPYYSLHDTFTRTTSNGWGTSDDAGTWSAGTASFSTNGSQALVTNNFSTNNELPYLMPPNNTKWEVRFRYSASSITTLTSIKIFDGYYASPSSDRGAGLGITINTDGSIEGYTYVDLGGTGTTLKSAGSYVATDTWEFRGILEKTESNPTALLKTWKVGDAEPIDYIPVTNASPYPLSGHFGIKILNQSTTTIDNLEITAAYLEKFGQAQAQISTTTSTTYPKSADYYTTIVDASPEAYWTLGESSGQFLDYAGNGHTSSTPVDITYGVTSGYYGVAGDTAVSGNGSTSRVPIPYHSALNVGVTNGPVTIEFLVKRASTGTIDWCLGDEDFTGPPGGGLAIGIGSPGTFWVYNGSDIFESTTTPLNDTNWHYVVWTKDGSSQTAYVDGVLLTNNIGSPPDLTGSTADWELFGPGSNSTSNLLGGTLDEVAIYTRVLTESEVKQHYDILKTSTIGPTFAQTQAKIKQTYNGVAQAQSSIKQVYNSFAQSQADVKQIYNSFAQAQAHIFKQLNAFSQSAALIQGTYFSWVDSFTRTIGSGLGTADSGDTYAGDDSYYSTDGSVALHTATDYNTYRAQYLAHTIIGPNAEGIFRYKISSVPTSGGHHYLVVSTHRTSSTSLSSGSNGYGVLIDMDSGTFGVRLIRSGTVGSEYIYPTGPDANWYWVRFKLQETSSEVSINFKLWKDGDTEPSSWNLSESYSTLILPPGHVAILGRSNDSSNPTIYIDDININSFIPYQLAQAQAEIKGLATYDAYAQAQSDIKQIYQGYGQSQVDVKQSYQGYSQAQSYIKTPNISANAQAQADIKQQYTGFAQGQGTIKQTYQTYAQTLALIARLIAFDDFNRTVASGWGVSSDGSFTWGDVPSSWDPLPGSVSPTDGGQLARNVSGINGKSGYPLLFDGIVQYDFWVPADRNDTTGIYNLDTLYDSTPSVYSAGADNQWYVLGSYFTPDASSWYTFKYTTRQDTGTISFKVWKVGTSEPSWTDTTTTVFGETAKYWYIQGFIAESAKVKNLYLWQTSKFRTSKFGQSQANIKQTYNGYAQSQADIKQVYNSFAQAQAQILQTYNAYAQAEAEIIIGIITYNIHAQAEADIKQTYDAYAQTQASILSTYDAFAQSQGWVETTYNASAQSQADILNIYIGLGQSQAAIMQTYNGFAQSQADIKQVYNVCAQAQTLILQVYQVYAQAETKLNSFDVPVSGQAQAWIAGAFTQFAQAEAKINVFNTPVYGQAQANILAIYNVYAQAETWIEITVNSYANAQADIKSIYDAYGQAQGSIKTTYAAVAQAQATIRGNAHAQAQADIKNTYNGLAQAQVWIERTYEEIAQAQADILQLYAISGQAQSNIKQSYTVYGQVQALILQIYQVSAQAQSAIKQVYQENAQAQAYILIKDISAFAQAQSTILQTYYALAQAQAFILLSGLNAYGNAQTLILQSYQEYAQAQSRLISFDYPQFAQAQAWVAGAEVAFGQAQATIHAYGVNTHGQAQANILQTYIVNANAQTTILAVYQVYAQAQPNILQAYQEYSQSQGQILQTYRGYAQSETRILQTYNAYAQTQSSIKNTYVGHGQAEAKINAFDIPVSGQAQAWIAGAQIVFAQAQGTILATNQVFAQAQAGILQTYVQHAQAQALIKSTSNGYAQAEARVGQIYLEVAQAQGTILSTEEAVAQSQADILQIYNGFAQAQSNIKSRYEQFAQAEATIITSKQAYGQTQSDIKTTYIEIAQAQSDILQIYQGFAQSQSRIKQTYAGYAQAQAWIFIVLQGHAQAEASIKNIYKAFAQAQTDILQIYQGYANASTIILVGNVVHAQATVNIKSQYNGYAQALALIQIGNIAFAQSQAYIILIDQIAIGYAQVLIIKAAGYGQAQAYIRVEFLLHYIEVSDISITLTLSDYPTGQIGLSVSDYSLSLVLSDTNYDEGGES